MAIKLSKICSKFFKMEFKLSFIILITISTSNCANILYMSLLPSPSHHIWNGAIINELAKQGHNVTVFSPFTEANAPSNIHYIFLEENFELIQKNFVNGTLNAKETNSPFYEAFLLQDAYDSLCTGGFETNGFQSLLNYPDNFKFHLVIYDFTVGPCFLPFLHKFNYPPLLAVSAYGHPSFLNDFVGGHHYYAYVPHNSLPYDDKMEFFQRLYNFLIYIEETILFQFYSNPKIDAITAKYFGPNVPSIGELQQKAALAFINTNPVMDYATPLPENVISVAGVQIKEPKPLPQSMKAFIENSKKGVVVVSFGTNFRSDYMPAAKRDIFLNVFGDLPDYHFIWKFESNMSSIDLPRNVQIQPWLPLSDVLADSNIKAIFFHGGLLTTQEALWRGVPMIIMPFGLDQRQNLIKTKRLGISEGVDYFSLDANQTKEALLKVLQNPSYASSAKKLSVQFRDQKEAPLDRAIWWIEWLIRNPNCDHLKSPVLRLGFIAGNAYDIIAFAVLFVVLTVMLSIILFCYCIKNCIEKTKVPKHNKVE